MSAAEIAKALGQSHRSGCWWRCRCPVHGSLGATLALQDGERGLIAKCHAGCDRRDVLAELRRRGMLGDASHDRHFRPAAIARVGDPDGAPRRIAVARRIWDAALDACGSPVARYLDGRGITIAPPPSLRWAPSLLRPDGTYRPAMVALVERVECGVVGVHRTYLARDDAGIWRRRDRASLGPIGGGAVRFAPAAATLMVGEGIETCLAAIQATALPAWAALSTSGLRALVLPPIVREIVILADNDANGAGERAARLTADRWLAEGRRVRIAMPPEPNADFNDALLGRAYAHVAEVAG